MEHITPTAGELAQDHASKLDYRLQGAEARIAQLEKWTSKFPAFADDVDQSEAQKFVFFVRDALMQIDQGANTHFVVLAMQRELARVLIGRERLEQPWAQRVGSIEPGAMTELLNVCDAEYQLTGRTWQEPEVKFVTLSDDERGRLIPAALGDDPHLWNDVYEAQLLSMKGPSGEDLEDGTFMIVGYTMDPVMRSKYLEQRDGG